ncbi:MAG: hypothetical protein HXX08_07665 [Chloroflexi bacterium]|uniref:Uncharacterized protein n=1 Tax=Candidatus Chlorohelix allophototropha TaxID=3003348 RepID=A0A8T7M178_9CHLR|nr:hypothetical protein [Chloroflexota bacterium]WJW67609.1 hypothetical protein OZ401_000878 [Chloroflexota bacterium L227-S17]
MQDEMHWQADRVQLRYLQQQHPDWSRPTLAQTLHRSLSWVKKWRKRLRLAPPTDHAVLRSFSTAPWSSI